MLSPGSTFAGYEVESVVGAGGIGILYRARQVRLDRPVALKLVEPDVARDPVVRERLRREARTVAALDHPNVVPLYEAGEEGGTVYIVTRWVEGTELGTLILSEGPMEPGRAARIAAQIAAALEVAHEKGLVHRDVKPSNVILTHEDHVYLTDFGLAKRAETAPGLTAVDQMLGTVDYVAPELIEGSEPDARSDVYSLGCVLFEMLTGEPPFADQKGGMAKMWAQVNAEPAVGARTATRRAGGARGGDAARDGQGARGPAHGGGLPGGACSTPAASAVSGGRRLRAGVEQLRGEHDPAECHPGGAVVGRRAPIEGLGLVEQPVPGSRLSGGIGRAGRGHEHDGMQDVADRPSGELVLHGQLGRVLPGEDRPCPGGDLPAGRVRILGHPHKRAHGVEAELRPRLRFARRADRHGLAALEPRPVRRQPRRSRTSARS